MFLPVCVRYSVVPRIITRPEDGAHLILTLAKESMHSQLLHSPPSTHEALLSQLPFFTPLSAAIALSEYSLLDILASRETLPDLFPWLPAPPSYPSAPPAPPSIASIASPRISPSPPPSAPPPRRHAAKSCVRTVPPTVATPASPTDASAALSKVLQQARALAPSPYIALGRDTHKFRTELAFTPTSARDGQTRLVWRKRPRVPQQRVEE